MHLFTWEKRTRGDGVNCTSIGLLLCQLSACFTQLRNAQRTFHHCQRLRKCCVHIWRERATHKLMLIYSTEMRGRQTSTNRLCSHRSEKCWQSSVCWAIYMFRMVRNVCRRLSHCHTNVNASNIVSKKITISNNIHCWWRRCSASDCDIICMHVHTIQFAMSGGKRPPHRNIQSTNLRFDKTNWLCVALNRMDRSQLSPVLNFFTHCQTNERNPEQKKN